MLEVLFNVSKNHLKSKQHEKVCMILNMWKKMMEEEQKK